MRLPEGALAVEAYYDSGEVWPAESVERRKALFSQVPLPQAGRHLIENQSPIDDILVTLAQLLRHQ